MMEHHAYLSFDHLANSASRMDTVLTGYDFARAVIEMNKTCIAASPMNIGADYRIRTDDLPLTRRLLYQLS